MTKVIITLKLSEEFSRTIFFYQKCFLIACLTSNFVGHFPSFFWETRFSFFNCFNFIFTHQAPADRWSLVSQIVSLRPSVKEKHFKTKHMTKLHAVWWVTLISFQFFPYHITKSKKMNFFQA